MFRLKTNNANCAILPLPVTWLWNGQKLSKIDGVCCVGFVLSRAFRGYVIQYTSLEFLCIYICGRRP